MFALGHPEKITDFAYRAVHETVVKSKMLITAFYGKAPKYSYWNGCSTGGRQALVEVTKFPDDFDGVHRRSARESAHPPARGGRGTIR